MAIYGAGSNWGNDERLRDFIEHEYFIIGWDYVSATDLIDVASHLKAGDIIYLKSNVAGSREIRVKAIGVVKTALIHSVITNKVDSTELADWAGICIPVKWIIVSEFRITIPSGEGKLTGTRASTIYEEYLPFVQQRILQELFKLNFKNNRFMDYGLGQFITGIISVGLQVLQIWDQTENVEAVRAKTNQFDEIASSQLAQNEGALLQQLVPFDVLVMLKGRVEVCWSDFKEAAGNPNITPRQLGRYTQGLKECICTELTVIHELNGIFPTSSMDEWWKQYRCGN